MELKKFYFVLTFEGFGGNWHKGTDLMNCIEALHFPKKYAVYTGVCKEDTPDEVIENLLKCFNVSSWGGLNFYDEPRERKDADPEKIKEYNKKMQQYLLDQEQAETYLIGWVTDFIYTSQTEYKKSKKK